MISSAFRCVCTAHNLKHRSPNNKHPLLFPPDPADHLVSPLGESRPRRIRPGHAIQLKQWRLPRQRYRIVTDAVLHLEMRRLGVYASVQRVIETHEAAAGDETVEMRLKGRHCELYVAAGFVEEVAQDGVGDDIRDGRVAFVDGGFDDGEGAVCCQGLGGKR